MCRRTRWASCSWLRCFSESSATDVVRVEKRRRTLGVPMTIAITAARIFDGKSDRIEEGGILLVEGERIVAAGANLQIPSHSEVIDLGDSTLCPGFIDAHTHLTFAAESYAQRLIKRYRQHNAANARQAAVN